MSDRNRYKSSFIPSERGIVTDRNLLPLITNQITYQALFIPDKNIDVAEVMERFYNLIDLSPLEKEKFISSIILQCRKNIKLEGVVIKKFLTWKELVKLEFNIEYFPGVYTQDTIIRVYNSGSSCAQVTGYVAPPTKKQVTDSEMSGRQLFMHPSFKIGQAGIEKSCESQLRGDYGINILEVDAGGHILQSVNHKQPVPGKNIITTLDIKLQNEVVNILGDRSGCAVLLDLVDGEILSLYSNPSFDPNNFLRGIDSNKWEKDFQQNNIMFNKVINGLYPPGSTFKIISALTALKEGLSPNHKYKCTGKFKCGNRIFHCNKESGHGLIDFNQAIAASCNCYFYHIITDIEINKLSEMAKIMGLGEQYNIGIGNESIGTIPTTFWKEKRFKKNWSGGESLNMVIGQGYLQVNPLQMAVMIARLATGNQLTPKLFRERSSTVFSPLNVNNTSLELVRKGVFSVFSDNINGVLKGYHQPENPLFYIAGKTGTAQVISKNFSKSSLKDVKIEQKAHGIFVGYGPYESENIMPRFAVAVIAEHALHGARAAGLGYQILHKAIKVMG